MINNCKHCNRPPKQNGTISCENKECDKFEVEHFVWDWQDINPGKVFSQDKFNEIFNA